MKKAMLFIGIVLASTIIIMFIAFNVVKMLDKKMINTEDEEIEEIEESEVQSSITDDDLEETEEKDLNPFGEEKKLEYLDDNDYANYIHGMSHQKVMSQEKWINYEMTQERIDWLLEGLENSKVPNAEVYKDILVRWQAGDFSQAVNDHNTVWAIQGGTIGEAYDLLSDKDEKDFIKDKYRQE